MSLPEISDVRRLRLKPGDALVVRVASDYFTPGQAEELRAEIRRRVVEALGHEVPVLVVTPEVSIEVAPAGRRP